MLQDIKNDYMKKVKTVALWAFLFLCFPTLMSATVINDGDNDSDVDWAPYIEAIALVETGNNPNMRSGIYAGRLAMSPAAVNEVNIILKSRGESKRYTMNDRLNPEKATEMFLIIQSRHNPENNIEKGIRMWNGGHRWQTERTKRYYNKVMAKVKL